MRALLISLLAVGAALANPAFAQSLFARDAGVYVAVDAIDVIRGGDDELDFGAGVGWRFGNGIDLGARVGLSHTRFDTSFEDSSDRKTVFGVEAAYTRWLSRRTGFRLETFSALGRTVSDHVPFDSQPLGGLSTYSQSVNGGAVDASLEAFRRVPVRGDISMQPTVGVYTSAVVQTVRGPDQGFSLRSDAGQSIVDSQLGVELALPVLFRVAGIDAAIDLRARLFQSFPVGSPQSVAARLHVNL